MGLARSDVNFAHEDKSFSILCGAGLLVVVESCVNATDNSLTVASGYRSRSIARWVSFPSFIRMVRDRGPNIELKKVRHVPHGMRN